MTRTIGQLDIHVKVCPFCGHDGVVVNFIMEAAVHCSNRECRATIKAQHAPRHDTGIEEVIEKWNRRIE